MSDPVYPPSVSLAPETSSERTSADSPAGVYPTAFPSGGDPLKPLLNPTLSDTSVPSSVIVEPPQTPNPANPATDASGNNAAAAAAPPATFEESAPSLPVAVDSWAPPPAPTANGDSIPPPPAEEPPAPVEDSQPPLPIDAPVPPTPPAPTDEVNPAPPADLIPPAVSTPTRIEVGEPDGSSSVEVPAQVDPIVESSAEDLAAQPILDETPREAAAELLSAPPPAAAEPSPSPVPSPTAPAPAPAPVQEEAVPTPPAAAPPPEPVPAPPAETVAPVETVAPAEVNPPSDDAMDVDADGETDAAPTDAPMPSQSSASLQPSASNGSMKRAGEDLDDGRDEKRIKEDPAPASTVPPGATAPLPVLPAALPPIQKHPAYVPAAPRPAGPTTPLTLTQHKYLLSVVRSMKKSKEGAIFAEPVDPVKFNIPTYLSVVTSPMDLGTVETKLVVSDPRGPPKDKSKLKSWDESKGRYGSVAEVSEDVRQIWENTRMFNGPDHMVSLAAGKPEATWETALGKLPAEPAAPAPPPIASPAAAGPSTSARRASISQPPAIRRTSDGDRPKREIHPPPSKELPYAEGARKPKRRLDNQLRWAERLIKTIETKHYTLASPFLYPVEDIIKGIPDYVKFIKKPIDLNHIKRKFAESIYEDVKEVDQDMRLMVDNAMKFNPAGDSVHTSAAQLKQIWAERFKEVPAKEIPREISEDPLGGDYIDEEDDEDEATIAKYQKQINDLQKKIDEIRERKSSRRQSKGGSASKPKAKAARKQSMSKASPNGNAPKKGRKKEMYADDDDESEEEVTNLTLSQKQDLAEKIGTTDADTLGKAIAIIQQTMNVGSDEEIELDIDSLPPATVVKLYNLVCRGGKGTRRPKGQSAVVQAKKPGRKATGGFGRKSMNEDEEAERISRIEQQLMSFENPGAGGRQYEESEESSEEEDSDEE